MNCNELKNQIDRYLDRQLPAAEAREVQDHLTLCPACREEYGPLIDLLTSPTQVNPPPGLHSKILTALNAPPVRRRNPWRFRFAAAAAIVLLALGWLVRPITPPPAPRHAPVTAKASPAQPDPWLLVGMVQTFAATGTLNPALPLVQARAMNQWYRNIYDYEPDLQPARPRYTLHLPEPTVTEVDLPVLEFALFSSMQKL